jgi:hypothetical protein
MTRLDCRRTLPEESGREYTGDDALLRHLSSDCLALETGSPNADRRAECNSRTDNGACLRRTTWRVNHRCKRQCRVPLRYSSQGSGELICVRRGMSGRAVTSVAATADRCILVRLGCIIPASDGDCNIAKRLLGMILRHQGVGSAGRQRPTVRAEQA